MSFLLGCDENKLNFTVIVVIYTSTGKEESELLAMKVYPPLMNGSSCTLQYQGHN